MAPGAIGLDWQALSAIAGGLVFLATLTLAIATFRLARAARRQVVAAEKQADAARAQADSSAELAEIAKRQLAVTSGAALRVVRTNDGVAARVRLIPADPGWGDTPMWELVIYNSGEASAMIERASVRIPGVGVRSGILPQNRAIGPTDEANLVFSSIDETTVEKSAAHSDATWSVGVDYREPGSTELRRFQATLKVKRGQEGRWRWTIIGDGTK